MGLKLKRSLLISLLTAIAIFTSQTTIHTLTAWAGPPFVTDDPEPVGRSYWEIDIAFQTAKDRDGITGMAPHFEVNYGLLPHVDLHILVPLSYVNPNDGPTNYGFGDIELGLKYRFMHDNDCFPMLGTSPLIQMPTGNDKRGLGSGHLRTFIPLWLQRTWEAWTTYGGVGYWINPGVENKNHWFVGWVVQRDLSDKITLGTELFFSTAKAVGESSNAGFNVGGVFNFTPEHHLLLSGGCDIHGPNRFAMYIGYQLTLGPREEKTGGLSPFIRNKVP